MILRRNKVKYLLCYSYKDVGRTWRSGSTPDSPLWGIFQKASAQVGSLPDPATRLAPRLSVLPGCGFESRGKQAGPATSSSRCGGRLPPVGPLPVATLRTQR
jgi:hypothetical protein